MGGSSDAINQAYKLYSENYKKVWTVFLVLSVLALAFNIVSMFFEAAVRFSEPICRHAASAPRGDMSGAVAEVVCENQLASIFVGTAWDILVGVILTVIILSSVKPLSDLLSGKPISEWTTHVSSQVVNTIWLYLIGIVQFISEILILIPFIVAAILIGDLWIGIGLVLVGFLLDIIWSIVLAIYLTFIRVELVVSNRGPIDAVKASVSLAKGRFWDLFAFHFIWVVVELFVGIAVFVTCCLAVFTGPLASYALVLPVRILSELILWREYKSPSQMNVEGTVIS